MVRGQSYPFDRGGLPLGKGNDCSISRQVHRVTKLALKMILLTGQRPGEVTGMTWAEIDEAGQVWNIPAGRMKNSEAQRVPLSPMALDVIEQTKAYSIDCDHVFRSSHRPEKPVPNWQNLGWVMSLPNGYWATNFREWRPFIIVTPMM